MFKSLRVAVIAACLMGMAPLAHAQTDNYAAPFGADGAFTPGPTPGTAVIAKDPDKTVPMPGGPAITVGAPPDGTVCAEIDGKKFCTNVAGAIPTTSPADAVEETRQAAVKVCSGVIPTVYEGFYEYINNNYENVTDAAMVFVTPSAKAGISADVLKSCLEYGYKPSEEKISTCEACYTINHSVPSGFYASRGFHAKACAWSGDCDINLDGLPSYLRTCIQMGYRPPEAPGYADASTCFSWW